MDEIARIQRELDQGVRSEHELYELLSAVVGRLEVVTDRLEDFVKEREEGRA